MTNWKQIPIPLQMQELPKDKRGYPIPYIIAQDTDGNYNFKINDTGRVVVCIATGRCNICGHYMAHEDRWFIGGPMSALHPNGVFIDTPVHRLCGQYALQVCPYMANGTYQKTTDATKIDAKKFGVKALHDPTRSNDRVPFFVLASVTGYDVGLRGPELHGAVFRPNRPYLAVEYWLEGKQLTRDEALRLLDPVTHQSITLP